MRKLLSVYFLMMLCLGWPIFAQDSGNENTAEAITETTEAETDLDPSEEASDEKEKSQKEKQKKKEKKTGFEKVEGLENWKHEIDVKGKKDGKYNILVRAKDGAGNIGYAGPYNIYIDPKSDLPVLRISNPLPDMRVGGNLNIVGTCFDDDAVESVEISIDKGEFIQADGKDFWSYYLKASDLEEGQHTITARGKDINGKTGNEVSVSFNLDKYKPVINISSHKQGALLNGKITLKGTVKDLNGIESLSMSLGSKKDYSPVKLSYNKTDNIYNFDLKIDTRKLEDGPQICWLSSQDLTGSVGLGAFLFFVDNQGPSIEVLYPPEEANINGKVTVVGKISDRVGIKKLSCVTENEQGGEIALDPGNPYWFQTFDYSNIEKAKLSLTVEDTTGNTVEVGRTINLNLEQDKPKVNIVYPSEGANLRTVPSLVGFINDDDGAKQVNVFVNGAEKPLTADSSGAFIIKLESIRLGSNSIRVQGVDINGVQGPFKELSFIYSGEVPPINFTQLSYKLNKVVENKEFLPGLVVPPMSKAEINGEISSLSSLQSAEISLNSGPWEKLSYKKIDASKISFSFSLPENLSGRYNFSVRLTDSFGQKSSQSSFVIGGTANTLEPGLILLDDRISIEEGILRMKPGDQIRAYLSGAEVQSAVLEPVVPFITVETQANWVFLKTSESEQGISEKTVLKVQGADGQTFNSDPLSIIVDTEGPQITIDSPQIGYWARENLSVSGKITDANGVASLEYSRDNGEIFTPLSFSGKEEATFSAEIPLAAMEDGNAHIIFRAKDASGKESLFYYPFFKDTEKARMRLICPGEEDKVNGIITVCGIVEDKGKIKTLEFSADGSDYQAVNLSGNIFTYKLDFKKYKSIPESFYFRAQDLSGNESILTSSFNVDLEIDKPRVEIQVPQQGELFRNDFTVSGMVFDDDEVKEIRYRIDGGDFSTLEGDNSFSIPISIQEISDNEHLVELQAVDINGVEGDIVSSTFNISKSEPVTMLLAPSLESHLKGVIELSGSSKDPNGIKEVFISFDNGLTYNLTEGTEQWKYALDTRTLSDGIYSIIIKAYDKTGTEGIYTTLLNVDNTAPVFKLDTPISGDIFSENILVDGKAEDNMLLVDVKMQLIPLEDGDTLSFDLPKGVFTREIEIEGLNPGWYNLRIEARDKADNMAYITRNIIVEEKKSADRVELIFPSDGIEESAFFTLSGKLVSKSKVREVSIYSGEELVNTVKTDDKGNFDFEFGPHLLEDGAHLLQARANLPGGVTISSNPRRIIYTKKGPWIKITSFDNAQFISGRPHLRGESGYFLEPPAKDADKETVKKYEKELKQHSPERIEVSFDNGRSFVKARGRDKWKLQLETQNFPNGPLRIIVRARFKDGSTRVSKQILNLDKKPPRIEIVRPQEGNRFNDEIKMLGYAEDENGVKEVEAALRKGDKAFYSVPGFIQGLYLDTKFLGVNNFALGAGLTFFDDNVKLQVQMGKAPDTTASGATRFYGYTAGAKLLANIANIPFSTFFGPDWEFFSMAVAIGANFTFFSMTNDFAFTKNTDDGKVSIFDEPVVIPAIVAQFEFARFEVKQLPVFKRYSLFTEIAAWFVSSDLTPKIYPKISFGARIGIF